MASRLPAFLVALTLTVLAILAGLGVGNLAQTRIGNLADLPLAVVGGRVDAGERVGLIGAAWGRHE